MDLQCNSVFGNLQQEDRACIKASQLGRVFLHEAMEDLNLQEFDVMVTSDTDVYPLNATALLAQVHATKSQNEYYRVWIHNPKRVIKSNHSYPMAFVGMMLGDW